MVHITPLVINSLAGGHTHKHTHTHTDVRTGSMLGNQASTPSASGSYGRQAGRLADKIRLDFEILKILYRLDFYFVYSSAMLLIVLEVHFSLLFSNKAHSRVCFVVRKIQSPLFFMLIPTIKY